MFWVKHNNKNTVILFLETKLDRLGAHCVTIAMPAADGNSVQVTYTSSFQTEDKLSLWS